MITKSVYRAAFQLGIPQHVLLPVVVAPYVQKFAIPIVKFHKVPINRFLQTGWKHSPLVYQYHSQIHITVILCSVIQIINDNVEKILNHF